VSDATFRCDHCGEKKPLAEREAVACEFWCTPCVDRFDLPQED
jgi:formylmethanofuran dehydrogenase subunit E